MNVLRSLCSASLLLVWVSANARIPVKVETFPLNDVRLTQSPFKHAEDLDVRYFGAFLYVCRHRRRRNQTEVGLHVVRIETCPRRCR